VSVQTPAPTFTIPYQFQASPTNGAARPAGARLGAGTDVVSRGPAQQPQSEAQTIMADEKAADLHHKKKLIATDLGMIAVIGATAVGATKSQVFRKCADYYDAKYALSDAAAGKVGTENIVPGDRAVHAAAKIAPSEHEANHFATQRGREIAVEKALKAQKPGRPKNTNHFLADFFHAAAKTANDGSYWGERGIQYTFISSVAMLGFNAIQTACTL